MVLSIDPTDSRVSLEPLHLAVHEPVIISISSLAKIRKLLSRSSPSPLLDQLLFRKRFITKTVAQVVHHRVLIIHGDKNMTACLKLAYFPALSYLPGEKSVEGHHVVINPDKVLLVIKGADGRVE